MLEGDLKGEPVEAVFQKTTNFNRRPEKGGS